MKVHLKMPTHLFAEMRTHLRLPHPVAFERLGFLACRGGSTKTGISLLAHTFLPVADDDYERDPSVGARISSAAIRKVFQYAYNHRQDVMLFVHEHPGCGKPYPSRTDSACWRELIPGFWNVTPNLPHGALILNEDSGSGRLWVVRDQAPVPFTDVTVVGKTLTKLLKGGRV